MCYDKKTPQKPKKNQTWNSCEFIQPETKPGQSWFYCQNTRNNMNTLFELPAEHNPSKPHTGHKRRKHKPGIGSQLLLPIDMPEGMRMDLPTLTLAELEALPALPYWLPEYRAAEAVQAAAWDAVAAISHKLRAIADGWKPQRRGVSKDDVYSALLAAATREISKWQPGTRQSRRRDGQIVDRPAVNPMTGALAYCQRKLKNGSIERDWLSGAMMDGSSMTISDAVEEGEELFAGECVANQVELSDQLQKILAELSKDRTFEGVVAEAVVLREAGRRPVRRLGKLKGKDVSKAIRKQYPGDFCGADQTQKTTVSPTYLWRIYRGEFRADSGDAVEAVAEIIRDAKRRVDRREEVARLGREVKALRLR